MSVHLGSADRQLMRQINQSVVLGSIRERGPISRTGIADVARLSLATVSGITADLIARGLVFEQTTGASTGGRRPILLALNSQAGLAVGAKLTESRAVVALTDLGTEVLELRELELGADRRPEAVADALAGLVGDLRAAYPNDRFLGLGLGLAGAIDRRAGTCRFSPFLQWRDVPFRRLLEARLRLPVVIENDVNTLTVAERWFGRGQGVADFVVVTLGRGVGMGMLLDGRLYRGGRGLGGEFGHTTVDPDGPPCDCGKRGCLEAIVCEPALLRSVAAAVGRGLEIEDAVALARSGHEGARAVFSKAGHILGIALANVVNVLNPTLLIVGGEATQTLDLLVPSLRRALEAHCFDGLLNGLALVVEPRGEDAWARGAAGLLLEELFSPTLERGAEGDRPGIVEVLAGEGAGYRLRVTR